MGKQHHPTWLHLLVLQFQVYMSEMQFRNYLICFQDQIQDTHVWTWVAPGVYFYQPKYPDKEAGRE